MSNKQSIIPYGRQCIDEEDIQAVVDVLKSDWITTGPKVTEFEQAIADFVEAKEAVAVNSGTAALHSAMNALNIGPGDEVILPPITFTATANAVVFQGGTPVFADVDPGTLLIDPGEVENKVTPRTKAIVAVDYAGHPCDYYALGTIAARHGLFLVADACHALGAEYKGRNVGTLADLTVFSFHPLKHITTGEGGMIVTDNPEFAKKMRRFRNHGINADHRQRSSQNTWYYEMEELGYNYRISDIQCALGLSQLCKLPHWIARRRDIANYYDGVFADIPAVEPLRKEPYVYHAYHLYVVRLNLSDLTVERSVVFSDLRDMGIGVNVHYIPVHMHPYYQRHFGYKEGDYPVAEKLYSQLISLPIYPGMNGQETSRVVSAVEKVVKDYAN